MDAKLKGVPAELIEPTGGFAEPVPPPKPQKHPTGWDPHVEERGNTATAISQPIETANPDEETLIRGWGLDPKLWRIVGHVNCRRWEASFPVYVDGKHVGNEAKWLHYFKADLERIDPLRVADIAEVLEEIRSHKPSRLQPHPSSDRAFVVAIADPQMGKADGDGTRGIVGRFMACIDAVAERQRKLRKIRQGSDTLYVVGLGDLVESCDGHYAQQAFRTELNRRDQVKVMRRLIVAALQTWAPMFSRVVVACVGGNHGENRKDGKSFTDFADNDDVAIFEQVAEILESNPAAYGHVSFVIPQDQLSLTLDVAGVVVGITHGHQAARGSTPQVKLVNWWRDQAHGRQPVGDADILLSGHYHHLSILRSGCKTHIQAPSLDGGSDWFRNISGDDPPPGMLTLTIGKADRDGWGNLAIL